MGWDSIIGDARILPTMGNANEVKFESGKTKQFRLLLPDGQQPYSYLEHVIETEAIDETGKKVTIFRTMRCPKTTKNPNAHCPICDGQQLKLRARNAANVWDFDLQQVQKLNHGESIFKPIATSRKMGVDILGCNWGVLKTGEGRNDTEYNCTNLGASPFTLPEGAQLFDIESDYAPHTIEEMKSIVESCGLTWEQVITLPTLEYPTLDEALAHVMPNGKHKDKTFAQMWQEDPSPKGMINFLGIKSNRINIEKAAAQVILVNLGGMVIDGVPKYGTGGAVISNTTPAPAPVVNTPAPAPVVNTPAPAPVVNTPAPVVNTPAPAPVAGGDRQSKINEINGLLATNQRFVQGGFTVVIETLKQASNGKQNIVEFTDAELDNMLALCKS